MNDRDYDHDPLPTSCMNCQFIRCGICDQKCPCGWLMELAEKFLASDEEQIPEKAIRGLAESEEEPMK